MQRAANHSRPRRLFAGLLCACLALSGLTACGSDSGKSGSSAGAATTGGDSSVSAAKAQLDKLYKGTYQAPPADGAKPEQGKKFWVVSVGQSLTSAAAASKAIKDASDKIGWDTTIFDGKGDPNTMLAGVRQAIAAKADAIAVLYIDCANIQSGLAEAKKAGIKTIAVESLDCDTGDKPGKKLFDHNITYVEGDFTNWIRQWGAAMGTWAIANTDGKAKMILFKETDIQTTVITAEGTEAELRKCSGCEVVETVNFVATDLGPKLQEKAQQAFLKHPDANVLAVGYDGVLTSGVLGALRAAGRQGKVKVIGGEGQAPNMDLMREGTGQDAGVGVPTSWEGLAALDAVIHLLGGKEPQSSGIGLQVYDKDHNLPKSGPYAPPVDYVAEYYKAWGVK
jgi:ribose transport system substrate-binding protein